MPAWTDSFNSNSSLPRCHRRSLHCLLATGLSFEQRRKPLSDQIRVGVSPSMLTVLPWWKSWFWLLAGVIGVALGYVIAPVLASWRAYRRSVVSTASVPEAPLRPEWWATGMGMALRWNPAVLHPKPMAGGASACRFFASRNRRPGAFIGPRAPSAGHRSAAGLLLIAVWRKHWSKGCALS